MATSGMISNAWGVSDKHSDAISFQCIVDETLAEKVHNENSTVAESGVIDHDQPAVMDSDADYAYALHLQEQCEYPYFMLEQGSESMETDRDLALAIQLQAAEESQYRQQLHSARNNTSTKVRCVQRTNPFLDALKLNTSYNDAKCDRMSECAYDDVAIGEGHIRSGSLFKDENGNVISKHDEGLCGRRNAQQIEKHHDVIVGADVLLPNKTYTALHESLRRDKVKGIKVRGKVENETRATKQGVLDERTRLILYKMVNRGSIDAVNGIVGTGKESNIYHVTATGEDSSGEVRHLAAKVFKTTLNEFSNRSDYVTGDHRYGDDYEKKDMLRQLDVWSKKEFSNLHRAHRAGLSVPLPFERKDHVLLMEFIGKEGWPAPQLRQARLTFTEARECYAQVLLALRKLFQGAELVHADLSEYNILYFEKRCWFIDFGQAVATSHPRSQEFLRRDIATVNSFFRRMFGEEFVDNELDIVAVCSGVMNDSEIYDFVVERSIGAVENMSLPYDIQEVLMQDIVLQDVVVS